MTSTQELSSAERDAYAQSIGKSSGAPSPASEPMSIVEEAAYAQSFPRPASPSARASDLTTLAEREALAQSLGDRHPAEGAANDQPIPLAQTAGSGVDRSIVNAAVLAAVDLAKGDQATAAFVLQTKASSDPQLRAALLAVGKSASANNLTQAAANEVAAFVNAGISRG